MDCDYLGKGKDRLQNLSLTILIFTLHNTLQGFNGHPMAAEPRDSQSSIVSTLYCRREQADKVDPNAEAGRDALELGSAKTSQSLLSESVNGLLLSY